MPGLTSELDQLTTEELAFYVVGEHEQDAARAVVEKFRHHQVASQLLRSYYLNLPEAREEMATDIRLVAEKQGTSLFALQTTGHCYFYLCSPEQSLYLGEVGAGIQDKPILNFFGFASADEFAAKMPDTYEELPPVTGEEDLRVSACVACGVCDGELHILGCPVELCPWCASQLSVCNCRFDKLGVDSIEDEVLLDRFEELLEKKGRVAFAQEQNPAYPTAGSDPLSRE